MIISPYFFLFLQVAIFLPVIPVMFCFYNCFCYFRLILFFLKSFIVCLFSFYNFSICVIFIVSIVQFVFYHCAIPILRLPVPICSRLRFPSHTVSHQPSVSPGMPQDLWFFRSSCFSFTHIAYPGIGLGREVVSQWVYHQQLGASDSDCEYFEYKDHWQRPFEYYQLLIGMDFINL